MTRALVAGSFDPITKGHVDIVQRALFFADDVVVAVGINPAKSYRFNHEQRLAMVAKALEGIPGVSVVAMRGALIECVREVGADVVVKGVRSGADLDNEIPQAVVNRDLGGVETVLLPSRPEYAAISSSLVREVLALGLDATRYVPQAIWPQMRNN